MFFYDLVNYFVLQECRTATKEAERLTSSARENQPVPASATDLLQIDGLRAQLDRQRTEIQKLRDLRNEQRFLNDSRNRQELSSRCSFSDGTASENCQCPPTLFLKKSPKLDKPVNSFNFENK